MSNCDAAVRIVRIDRKFKVLLREGLRVGAVECQQRVHECERRYMITEEMAVYRKGYVQKGEGGCRLYRNGASDIVRARGMTQWGFASRPWLVSVWLPFRRPRWVVASG